MKIIPTFQCYSCGNCEQNYHNDPASNKDNGFCVRFFQNVPLDEKNFSCWTTKQHTHYEDLSKLKPELLKNEHFRNFNKGKKLNIDLNQPTLF